MSSKRKQEQQFSLDSPVITIGKQSKRTVQKTQTIYNDPKLLTYIPPDALMFALFSAIQRRAWIRARKLCYELILCDPLRKTYRDLHDRIDQIIRVINQRTRSRMAAANAAVNRSRTSTASSDDTIIEQKKRK